MYNPVEYPVGENLLVVAFIFEWLLQPSIAMPILFKITIPNTCTKFYLIFSIAFTYQPDFVGLFVKVIIKLGQYLCLKFENSWRHLGITVPTTVTMKTAFAIETVDAMEIAVAIKTTVVASAVVAMESAIAIEAELTLEPEFGGR